MRRLFSPADGKGLGKKIHILLVFRHIVALFLAATLSRQHPQISIARHGV
jgi:hypothetical protein